MADDLDLTAPDLDDEGRAAVAAVLAEPRRAAQLAAKAADLGAAFARRMERIQAAVAEGVELTRRERERNRPSLDSTSPHELAVLRKHDERAIEARAAELRRELVASSEQERTDMLRQLHALERQASAVAPLFASPVAMLSRAALGDRARTDLQAQLSGAGPAELAAHARLAVATGDRRLGAAVLSALDRMPTKDRPFRANALAESLVGDEHREVARALAAVRNRAQESINANREFTRGRGSAVAKITEALARRAEAKR
jgi:hypothetical protein